MFISLRHKIGTFLFTSVFLLILSLIFFQQLQSYLLFRDYIRSSSQTIVELAIGKTSDWIESQKQSAVRVKLQLEKISHDPTGLDNLLKDLARNPSVLAVGYLQGSGQRTFYSDSGIAEQSLDWSELESAESLNFRLFEDRGRLRAVAFFPLQDTYGWSKLGRVALEIDTGSLQSLLSSAVGFESALFTQPEKDTGKTVLYVIPEGSSVAIFNTTTSGSGIIDDIKKFLLGSEWTFVTQEMTGQNILLKCPISMHAFIKPLMFRVLTSLVIAGLLLWLIMGVAWQTIGRLIRRIEAISGNTSEIAKGDFDIQIKRGANDELGRLTESFNQMTKSLKFYTEELERTTREKEAVAKELEIAASLQERALPKKMPSFSGLQIAARSYPAKAVGGDYYDFVFPDDSSVGFVIADAAGKGFPGSWYMSNSRSVFKVISMSERSPSEMLKKTNEFIAADDSDASEGMFITYVYGLYNSAEKKLTYCNAGHFPPFYYSAKSGGVKPLPASGLPLGIMGGQDYEEESVEFQNGDVFMMYTDGFIEAMNPEGDMYSEEKLQDDLKRFAHLPAADMVEKISESIHEFCRNAPQHDDMTMLIIKSCI